MNCPTLTSILVAVHLASCWKGLFSKGTRSVLFDNTVAVVPFELKTRSAGKPTTWWVLTLTHYPLGDVSAILDL